MDGNTPIDTFASQFSQRDASEIAGVPMPTINNWIKREAFRFTKSESETPSRRRLFSIVDIARLHAMRFCTEHLELSPEAASIATGGIIDYFGGSIREIAKDDGGQFEVWHWAHRTPYSMQDGWHWSTQGVWMNPSTGAFYQYHPGIFKDEEPGGPPHFPCICIPTSQLSRRMFLACADQLIAEHAEEPGAKAE